MNKRFAIVSATLFILSACTQPLPPIDREALVTRNNPVVERLDTLASLSVGNGRFACLLSVVTSVRADHNHAGGRKTLCNNRTRRYS